MSASPSRAAQQQLAELHSLMQQAAERRPAADTEQETTTTLLAPTADERRVPPHSPTRAYSAYRYEPAPNLSPTRAQTQHVQQQHTALAHEPVQLFTETSWRSEANALAHDGSYAESVPAGDETQVSIQAQQPVQAQPPSRTTFTLPPPGAPLVPMPHVAPADLRQHLASQMAADAELQQSLRAFATSLSRPTTDATIDTTADTQHDTSRQTYTRYETRVQTQHHAYGGGTGDSSVQSSGVPTPSFGPTHSSTSALHYAPPTFASLSSTATAPLPSSASSVASVSSAYTAQTSQQLVDIEFARHEAALAHARQRLEAMGIGIKPTATTNMQQARFVHPYPTGDVGAAAHAHSAATSVAPSVASDFSTHNIAEHHHQQQQQYHHHHSSAPYHHPSREHAHASHVYPSHDSHPQESHPRPPHPPHSPHRRQDDEDSLLTSSGEDEEEEEVEDQDAPESQSRSRRRTTSVDRTRADSRVRAPSTSNGATTDRRRSSSVAARSSASARPSTATGTTSRVPPPARPVGTFGSSRPTTAVGGPRRAGSQKKLASTSTKQHPSTVEPPPTAVIPYSHTRATSAAAAADADDVSLQWADRYKSLLAKNLSLQKKNRDLALRGQAYASTIQELQASVHDANDAQESLASQLRACEDRLASVTRVLRSERESAGFHARQTRDAAEVASVNELNRLRGEYDARQETLECANAELKRRAKHLQHLAHGVQTKLDTRNAEADTAAKEANQQIAALQASLAETTSHLHAASAKVTRLQRAQAERGEEAAALSDRLEAAQRRESSLTQRLVDSESDRVEVTRAFRALQAWSQSVLARGAHDAEMMRAEATEARNATTQRQRVTHIAQPMTRTNGTEDQREANEEHVDNTDAADQLTEEHARAAPQPHSSRPQRETTDADAIIAASATTLASRESRARDRLELAAATATAPATIPSTPLQSVHPERHHPEEVQVRPFPSSSMGSHPSAAGTAGPPVFPSSVGSPLALLQEKLRRLQGRVHHM